MHNGYFVELKKEITMAINHILIYYFYMFLLKRVLFTLMAKRCIKELTADGWLYLDDGYEEFFYDVLCLVMFDHLSSSMGHLMHFNVLN